MFRRDGDTLNNGKTDYWNHAHWNSRMGVLEVFGKTEAERKANEALYQMKLRLWEQQHDEAMHQQRSLRSYTEATRDLPRDAEGKRLTHYPVGEDPDMQKALAEAGPKPTIPLVEAVGLRYKSLTLVAPPRAVGDDVLMAYASTWDLDNQRDVVVKGAFALCIAQASTKAARVGRAILFPLCWQHDMTDPVGGVMEASEDTRGLRVRLWFDTMSPQGQRAYIGLKTGLLSLSIGYKALQAHWSGGTRYLDAVELHEISVVTRPANEGATVIEPWDPTA